MKVQRRNIEIVSGDYVPLTVRVVDANDQPIDTLGSNLTYAIAINAGHSPLVRKTTGDGITRTGVGEYLIEIGEPDTTALEANDYYHELSARDGLNRKRTIFIGTCTVLENLTS